MFSIKGVSMISKQKLSINKPDLTFFGRNFKLNYSIEKELSFKDEIIKMIPIFIQSYTDSHIKDIYTIIHKDFVNELIVLFQTYHLNNNGYSLDSEFYPDLENLQSYMLFRNLRRLIRYNLTEQTINLKQKIKKTILKTYSNQWFTLKFKPKILITKINKLTLKHAKKSNKRVKIIYLSELYSYEKNSVLISKNTLDNFTKNIVKITKTIFEKNDTFFEDNLYLMITAELQKGISNLNRLYNSVNDAYLKKYEQVWSGSGGNIWQSIVNLKARRIGIKVVGHAHGFGIGPTLYFPKNLYEYNFVDEYIDYTKKTSSLSELCFRNDLQPTLNFTKFRGLNGVKEIKIKKPLIKENKIMFLSAYKGNIIDLAYNINDFIILDFEIRLLNYFKKGNYDIIYKPHPSIFRPKLNESIISKLDINVELKKFEEVYENYDVFIFDSIRTTTFATALKSGRSIVLLIHDHADSYDQQGLKILSKRCGIVKTRMNTNNRLELDWETLNSTIEKSHGLRDSQYVYDYIGM